MTAPLPRSGALTGPTLAEVRSWPATVDIPAAARALGLSRAYAYELIRRGAFPVRTITVGQRHRVLTASLLQVLDPDA